MLSKNFQGALITVGMVAFAGLVCLGVGVLQRKVLIPPSPRLPRMGAYAPHTVCLGVRVLQRKARAAHPALHQHAPTRLHRDSRAAERQANQRRARPPPP